MGRPGAMKRRLVIERPTTTTDEYGGQEVTFTTVGEIWAEVRRFGGGRGLDNSQTSFNRPFSIVTRSNIAVKEDDELTFENMRLVISSVDRDYNKFKYQTLTADAKYSG